MNEYLWKFVILVLIIFLKIYVFFGKKTKLIMPRPKRETRNKKIKLDVVVQEPEEVFPIQDLPLNVLKIIFSYLSHKCKEQLRFVSRWFNNRVVQLDVSFRTFRNLPKLERYFDVEHLKMNLNNMLKNPVYGQNKLKMYLTIINPDLSYDILPTFLKANRQQIVSLTYEFTSITRILFWDPYLISYPNLEELSLTCDSLENDQGLVSWMLKKHHKSLQKLHLYGASDVYFSSVPKLQNLTHLELECCDEKTTNLIIQNCSSSLEFLLVEDSFPTLFYLDKHNLQKLKHFIFKEVCNTFLYDNQSTSTKHLQSLYFEPYSLSSIKNCNFSNLELLWTTRPQNLPTLCPKLRFLAVTNKGMFLNEDEGTLEAPPKDGFNLEVFICDTVDTVDTVNWWSDRVMSNNAESLRVVIVPNKEECILWDLPSRLNYNEPRIISSDPDLIENEEVEWLMQYMKAE